MIKDATKARRRVVAWMLSEGYAEQTIKERAGTVARALLALADEFSHEQPIVDAKDQAAFMREAHGPGG